MKRHLRLAALVTGVAILAAACSSGGASTAPSGAASTAPSTAAGSAAPSAGGALAYQGEITFWNTQRDIENDADLGQHHARGVTLVSGVVAAGAKQDEFHGDRICEEIYNRRAKNCLTQRREGAKEKKN